MNLDCPTFDDNLAKDATCLVNLDMQKELSLAIDSVGRKQGFA